MIGEDFDNILGDDMPVTLSGIASVRAGQIYDEQVRGLFCVRLAEALVALTGEVMPHSLAQQAVFDGEDNKGWLNTVLWKHFRGWTILEDTLEISPSRSTYLTLPQLVDQAPLPVNLVAAIGSALELAVQTVGEGMNFPTLPVVLYRGVWYMPEELSLKQIREDLMDDREAVRTALENSTADLRDAGDILRCYDSLIVLADLSNR